MNTIKLTSHTHIRWYSYDVDAIIREVEYYQKGIETTQANIASLIHPTKQLTDNDIIEIGVLMNRIKRGESVYHDAIDLLSEVGTMIAGIGKSVSAYFTKRMDEMEKQRRLDMLSEKEKLD